MLLTQPYTGIKEPYHTAKFKWDQVLTPRRSSPHALAQRQSRANNHLQTKTRKPVENWASLQTRTAQVLVDTGVPWQNKPKVKHWCPHTLSIQEMAKWSMKGFTFIPHNLKATAASIWRGIQNHAQDVEMSLQHHVKNPDEKWNVVLLYSTVDYFLWTLLLWIGTACMCMYRTSNYSLWGLLVLWWTYAIE